MIGKHVKGAGKAGLQLQKHTHVFNASMVGTYNVRSMGARIRDYSPSIVLPVSSYWFVEIEKGGESWFGWAVRDHTSKQRQNTFEVLTKKPLPVEKLAGRTFNFFIHEKWDAAKTETWASHQYWFQTFPFSPEKRADSEFLWKTINKIKWSGLRVLDIGCHYGYMSFEASKLGATVTGYEPNKTSLQAARTIQKNIIQQDVCFTGDFEKTEQYYDVILYLSVHHQIDPSYANLKEKIETLKSRVSKCLFVELILPPVFPKGGSMSENDIDECVGGKVITTYKHRVRGMRRVYQVDV